MSDAADPTLVLNATTDDAAAMAQVLGALTEQGFTVRIAPVLGRDPEPRDMEPNPDETSAAVLTVWSRGAILNEDVVSRASDAMRRGRLLPVRIEDVEPPIGFRQVQTFDLVHLVPDAAIELAHHIRCFLGIDKKRSDDLKSTQSLVRHAAKWVIYNTLMAIILYLFSTLEKSTHGDVAFLIFSFPVLVGVIVVLMYNFPKDTFHPANGITVVRDAWLNCRHEVYIQVSVFIAMITVSGTLTYIVNSSFSVSEFLLMITIVGGSISGAVLLRYVLIRSLCRFFTWLQEPEGEHG